MLKKIILGVFVIASIYGCYQLVRLYKYKKEESRRSAYYENLKESASPTVTVLRDSIPMGYRNEKKTIHVYVPPEYENDTSSRYPVIYMLDGESCFNEKEFDGPEWQVDEIIDKASADGKNTAIVIGINEAEDRNAEYTPWVDDDNPEAHGEDFSKWVTNDLKAWVDKYYRTDPSTSATTIGGISRSGMMAYYMIMEHPDIFGNALIQSPSMWVDYDRLLGMELTPDQLADKKFYISVGEKEGNMVNLANDTYAKFKSYGLDDTHLRYDIIPKEGHWHVTWRKSFAKAYPWLMED